MTLREATGILPRAEKIGPSVLRKSLSDWAHILYYGIVGAPRLILSLSGGPRRARRALLERLRLPADALPNLGSWKADAGFLSLIVDEIETRRPVTVVEFGAGATSLVAARALKMNGDGRLVSFDQYADYIEATRRWLNEHDLSADLRHAPLTATVSGWPGRWYDHGPLPDRIDLLIVDGPNWAVHPFARGAAERLFSRIPPGGAIMLDDGARPGERVIAQRWKKRWPNFDFTLLKAGAKGTLIGRRR